MTYPIDETFDTDIPSGFASLHKSDIKSLTATYNASAHAVDLLDDGQQAMWRIDAAGARTSFSFTADLELVADYAGGNHMGLWLTDTHGDAGELGVRFVSSSRTGFWGMGSYVGGITSGVTPNLSNPLEVYPPYSSVGTRVRVRAEYRPCLHYKGLSNIYFFMDDVLVAWLPNFTTVPLYPAVVLYGTLTRIHSIKLGDATLELLPELGGSMSDRAPYRYTNPAQTPPQVTSIHPQKVISDAFVQRFRSFTRWQSELSPLAANFFGDIVSGLVTIQGAVAGRKVRLYNKSTGQLVGQVMSGIDGSYAFTNLDPSFEYFAVAHDHTRTYNAVIQDMIQP